MKSAILGLRNNPDVSALDGRRVRLGQQGVARRLAGPRRDRHRPLHGAFPRAGRRALVPQDDAGQSRACRARRCSPPPRAPTASIFYDAGGNARSLGDIYQRFAAKLDKGAAKVGAVGLASDTLDGNAGLIPAVFRKGGDFETAKANFAALAGMTNLGDATVITGSGDSNDSAAAWAKAALARADRRHRHRHDAAATANSINLLRPTPDTARLAYMMLASLGANRT